MPLETTLAEYYVGCENIQGEGLKYVTKLFHRCKVIFVNEYFHNVINPFSANRTSEASSAGFIISLT
jgi:hypothetical protein